MFLSTITDEDEVRYRAERIALFKSSADQHFEETCERLCTGGVKVKVVLPEDYFDGLD